ncbi:MAG: hypothetical protein K2H18_01945, partial [Muribaculaceae bacterium]|nr:hypothetical protein [Muribaculaceae bacterium]
QEAIERKIAEDNRVARIVSETNAKLQVETNRRIQSDYYNAKEGAQLALQRAKQANQVNGPQFQRKQLTGSQKAQILRSKNKPLQPINKTLNRRNIVRKQLPKVERKHVADEQEMMIRKAILAKYSTLTNTYSKGKGQAQYKGIELSDKPISTLGKNWQSEDFKAGPLAPPPTYRRPKYVEPEWLTKHKKIIEMLGQPPLTDEEELQLLKEHEFLGS